MTVLAVLTTAPTTLPGFRVLLDYVTTEGEKYDLMNRGRRDLQRAATNFLDHLAASFRLLMARQGS